MKTIVIVSNEMKSVVAFENEFKVFESTSKRTASLKAYKHALELVPELTDERYRIVVTKNSFLYQLTFPQTFRYYLINNKPKAANGAAFTAEETALLKEIHQLQGIRHLVMLNIISDQQIKREEKETHKLLKAAKAKIESAPKTIATPAAPKTSPVAMLEKQLEKAIEEGDLDKMDRLTIMIERLNNKPVEAAPVVDTEEEAEAEANFYMPVDEYILD